MPPSQRPSPTTGLTRRLNQWVCGVHGHDTQLQIGSDRLLLRCSRCGYASPGWVVQPPGATSSANASTERLTTRGSASAP